MAWVRALVAATPPVVLPIGITDPAAPFVRSQADSAASRSPVTPSMTSWPARSRSVSDAAASVRLAVVGVGRTTGTVAVTSAVPVGVGAVGLPLCAGGEGEGGHAERGRRCGASGRRQTERQRRGRSRPPSVSAGWIQYWPRAIVGTSRPVAIAWMSGWISTDASGPMMWAPSRRLVVLSASSFTK